MTKTMRQLAATLLTALFAVAGAAGQDAAPAADNAALARQFLDVAQQAIARKDSDKAEEALAKAMRYDPTLAEAPYRLARLRQAAGAAHEAAGHYKTFLGLFANGRRPTAEEVRLKADAEAQLRRLDVYPQRWLKLRTEWAKRFRDLGAGSGASPSCVRALEIASLLASADEKIAAEHQAAAKLLAGAMPAVAARKDKQGAKLLIDRAAKKKAEGRTADVIELLRSAYTLDGNLETLVTLAEVQLADRKPAEAAASAAAAGEILRKPGKGADRRRKKFAPRVRAVLKRADPNGDRVEALLKQFAVAAEGLAKQSRAGNDLDTAREIRDLIDKLRGDEQGFGDEDSEAPTGNTPVLNSKYVKVRAPAGARTKRTDKSFEYVLTKTNTVQGGAEALVGLARFACGQTVRATWRIETLSEKSAGPGKLSVGFLPSVGVVVDIDKETVEVRSDGRDSLTFKADSFTRQDMVSRNGDYTVTFEKIGPDVSITVNRRSLARFRLSAGRQADLARSPMVLSLSVDGRHKQQIGLRVTLTRFDCSKDSILKAK